MKDFDLLENLKNNFFKKETEKIYYNKISDIIVYFIYKPSFEDLESLLRESKILISCHGALSHAANSFNIEILDIIEESKKEWYNRFTLYLKRYKPIFRNKFSEIEKDLLVNIS